LRDLSAILAGKEPSRSDITDQEARLCQFIEWLYSEKDRLGPETFAMANRRVREALRQLLDQELKVAGKTE